MTNKSEVIPAKPDYTPHFNNLREMVANRNKLGKEALLLEIAHLKYELGQETMELMAATKSLAPRIRKEVIRLISLVALSDLPDVEELIEEEDKEAILEAIKIVKSFKHNIKTKH